VSQPVVVLAPGVVRIPTMGDFINSFAFLENDGSVTLVDCGLKQAPAKIVSALEHLGKRPADVNRIILTHAHGDHAGGGREMLERTGVDGVAIHEDDIEYIAAGENAPPDLNTSSGRLFLRMPGRKFAPFAVSHALHDGEVVDVAGGLRILHTPGHTPGHVSMLHEPTGVLITGDALFNPFSRMRWPMAAICTSARQNRESAQVFSDLEYQVAAFTHGTEIRDNAREAIRSFLRRNAGA
jgi:glyoxylase-like metal-dependent hydrolase (beta-lactamase superfamily II)